MKAAVYDMPGPPSVLRYADVPEPTVRSDQVLIAVEAISIEGGDLINRRTAVPPGPSHVPGYAAAGTVVAVGSCVRDRKVGDRVVAFDMDGSYAELWAVSEIRTWPIPYSVDAASAAIVPISFGTANHCLFARAHLRRGETVLIQAAAGGLGLAAVQLAHRIGAHVLAVASGKERCKKIRSYGAYHVIDRLTCDVLGDVKHVTGDRGVDVAFDPVGTTLRSSLKALAPEGRLVFVGNAGGSGLEVDLWAPMQANQTLLGVFMGAVFEKPKTRAMVSKMLEAVASKTIQPVIDRTFPLSEAAGAHAYAEDARPLGRVILRP